MDLISRQAAIDAQITELRTYAKDRKGELAKLVNDAADTIEALSKTECKTGRWVYDEERCATGIYAICTACNEEIYQTGDLHYCPNCGARMEEEDG